MADNTAQIRCCVETTNKFSEITNELRRYAILDALDPGFLSTVTMGYVFNKGKTALLVTNSDDVYGVHSSANDRGTVKEGPDDLGTLAYARTDDLSDDDRESPVMWRIEQLSHKNVVDFASNDKQVVALTDEGTVSWCDIQCCVEDKSSGADEDNSDDESTKTRWTSMAKLQDKIIIHVAFGRNANFLLTREGELLHWSGTNSNFKSFWFQEGVYVNSAQCNGGYNITTKIVSIEYANKQLLALSSDGVVYEQSFNDKRQHGTQQIGLINVGRGTSASVYSHAPSFGSVVTEIHFVKTGRVQPVGDPNVQFANIAAYENLLVAQTVTGKVYVWGKCLDRVLLTPTETYITKINNIFPILAKTATTPKPIKSDQNKDRYHNVKNSIAAMFDDAEHSDVIFTIGGKSIRSQKFFLKSRCDYFNVMFSSEWKECITGVIEITNYSYVVYRAFLYYLYTDELDISYEDAVEMLDLAQSYGESSLKLRCERVIEWWIRDNNAATIYQLAVKYECSTLQDACVRYGVGNMNAIALSAAFRKIESETARDFVVKTAEIGAFLSGVARVHGTCGGEGKEGKEEKGPPPFSIPT